MKLYMVLYIYKYIIINQLDNYNLKKNINLKEKEKYQKRIICT